MSKSQDLYTKAKNLIPGGTQLLSKRPEMHAPGIWPAYFSSAKGCRVTDLDGNTYCDFSYMGVGTNVLGYADDDVNAAVVQAVSSGNVSTLNAPEEVELAEELCKMHPWASMARFAKSGGEANCIAIRIARAHTKKEIVLFCGYHGWHDWYLSANLEDPDNLKGHLLSGLEANGVPSALMGTAYPFAYNDFEGFKSLVSEYDGKIAAVIMEPIRSQHPTNDFLQKIRQVTSEREIPLIFDEISSGFRMNLGGAHLTLGVEPDIAVFGKTISNGYPMAAVIGKREIMDTCQSCFISSTYWTDKLGVVAALAFLKKFQSEGVAEHIQSSGNRVQEIWRSAAKNVDLEISVFGISALSSFAFTGSSALMKTLFVQEMLREGFLASTAYYASYAHKVDDVDRYQVAVNKVFEKLSNWKSNKELEKHLLGPICHQGFKRLA